MLSQSHPCQASDQNVGRVGVDDQPPRCFADPSKGEHVVYKNDALGRDLRSKSEALEMLRYRRPIRGGRGPTDGDDPLKGTRPVFQPSKLSGDSPVQLLRHVGRGPREVTRNRNEAHVQPTQPSFILSQGGRHEEGA